MFVSFFFLMIRRPPRSTRTDTLFSLHDALPIFGSGPDRRLRNARHPDEPALRGRSMTRVTNLAAQNLSLALLQQTQSRVMDAQVQISTGQKVERYICVGQDAARLVILRGDHASVLQLMAAHKMII